jgi:aryl-alcohol dehydrogenase-like predicted oxidoreductase
MSAFFEAPDSLYPRLLGEKKLRKRKIGQLDVTVVGVGCYNFGRLLDLEQTRTAIYSAIDHGINFFDTSDRYGNPRTNSESVIGEAIQSRRNEIIIATKFGGALDEQRHGAKAAYVKSATEASLRRLRMDHIDLMQLHAPDPTTPIAETLGALSDLVTEGKIREIGASNFSDTQLREAATAAASKGVPGFVSTQSEYSLLNRAIESDVLPECQHLGIGILPYFPLYYGLLTGKYRKDQPGSFIGILDEKRQSAIFSERNVAIVAALNAYAEQRGRTLLELAFAWLLSHPVIPSVIAGVSSLEHVAANATAADWELTAAEIVEIERLAPLDMTASEMTHHR